VRAVPGFLQEMQRRCFDVALQLHGSGRLMNSVTLLFGARVTAGFHPPGEPAPRDGHFIEWRPREHEILRFARLVEALGAPPTGADLEFPVSSAELEDFRRLEQELGLEPGGYACIHAGSQLPSRRWSPERFAAVADALREGVEIVLTGTSGEADVVARVGAAMRQPAVNLTGRTSLGVLAELVRRARLVVCNDTGISHIAAAMHAPSVVVSCGADTDRWSPLDRVRHRVLFHPIACRPCAHARCPIGHPCAEAVHVEDVLAEARSLLSAADRSFQESPACVP
jgi:ADP-heptose:LPS heptosyltransferase